MNISPWLYILASVVYMVEGMNPNTNLRIKRTICKPVITFENCKSDSSNSNPMWKLHGSVENFFEIDIIPGCESSDFRIEWELRDKKTGLLLNTFVRFKDKMTLLIYADALSPNDYILRVKVTEKSPKNISGYQTADCWIRSLLSNAIAYIKGGAEISTFFNETITFDGSHTIERANKNVMYSWKCKPVRGTYKDCKNMMYRKGKVAKMKIEGNVGTEYIITLTVSSKGVSDSMSQKVVVAFSNSPKFELRCIKNCMEAGTILPDMLFPIYFRIFCKKNCEGNTYRWTVMKNGRAMSPDISKFQFNTDKLYLIKGMDKGATIHVSATVHNAKNKASNAKRTFKMADNIVPKIDCSVNPNNGISLVTNFNIKCNINVDTPLMFYVTHNFKFAHVIRDAYLAFASVPQFVIKIAAEQGGGTQNIRVVAEDESQVTTVMPVTVKVISFLDKSDSTLAMKKLIDIYDGKTNYTKSVKSMIKYGKYSKAIQIMHVLLAEQKQLPNDKHLIKLKNEFLISIMDDILTYFPSERFEIMAFINFLILLQSPPGEPMDVKFAALKTKLCKELSIALDDTIRGSPRPYTFYFNVLNLKTCLTDCANVIIVEKFGKPTGIQIERPNSIDDHPTLNEDYPNYEDVIPDPTAADQKEISVGVLDVLKYAGSAFARTIAPGEPEPSISPFLSVKSEYANFVNKKFYSTFDTAVKLPSTLGLDDEDEVRVVYASFARKSFAEHMNQKVIHTSVINLNILTKHGMLRDIKYPVNYIFFIQQPKGTKMHYGEVIVPTNEKNWVSEIIDFNITVIRVEVRNGSTLFARFYNITPVDELLVVTAKFRRPKLKDFKRAKTIKSTGFISAPVAREDCWYYIAILPKKEEALKRGIQLRQEEIEDAKLRLRFGGDYSLDMIVGEESGFRVTYSYIITSETCMEWKGKVWRRANCEVKNAFPGQMRCQCNIITTLAGQVYALSHKPDNIKNIRFHLKLQLHYIVYAATAIVVSLYCIALCFALIRAQARRTMYFLGDNLKDERYAYFIIVRTESWTGSGTTSNVTIKLHGIKNESKVYTRSLVGYDEFKSTGTCDFGNQWRKHYKKY